MIGRHPAAGDTHSSNTTGGDKTCMDDTHLQHSRGSCRDDTQLHTARHVAMNRVRTRPSYITVGEDTPSAGHIQL
jgi:hypothetical protein